MKLEVTIGEQRFAIDSEKAIDISIPLHFGGPQPNFFGVPPARSKTFEGDGFVGDTKRGGSCNVKEIHFNPQCSGTHTESIAHIVNEEVPVFSALTQTLFPSVLITLRPEPAEKTADTYHNKKSGDFLITRDSLCTALKKVSILSELKALILRTLPNEISKKTRAYGTHHMPAYLSNETMTEILQLKVDHLLLDLPSADKMHDEGKLSNHHLFWNVPSGKHNLDSTSKKTKTITEFIFVNDDIIDGNYLLDLQIPSFMNDAAPSRPLIYKLELIK